MGLVPLVLTSFTVLCLTIPHVLYAAIWLRPELWRRRFKGRSVRVFAKSAGYLKVLQFGSLVLWISGKTGRLSNLLPAPPSIVVALLCGTMLVCGQVLNIAIYKAIGRDGVYYGFKLGRPVPWHHGFPFNIVSHPQYVGSVLTIWGCAGLYWKNLPEAALLVCIYWSGLYVLTGLQEQYL